MFQYKKICDFRHRGKKIWQFQKNKEKNNLNVDKNIHDKTFLLVMKKMTKKQLKTIESNGIKILIF